MKKLLIAVAITLVVALSLIYAFRAPLKEAVYARVTADMFVEQDTDSFDPGPALGSRFPGIQASYQGQTVQLLEPFAGTRGTVFVASRSLDWCPYCMRQLVQLQEHKPGFDQAGIGMVAITYDAPALQQAFINKFDITIPVLSDIDASSFKTLGILNQTYEPGATQYGIPHPGIIVVNPAGEVVGKLFLAAYSSRVDSAAVLAFALDRLQQ